MTTVPRVSFFFSSRRRHTRLVSDWSSDVCSSDLSHFIQEPFDQAGIVRPYAKWEWTLPSGVMTKETLRRAHTVAHSDPMGPVYLMLPRETLTQTWDEAAMRPFPQERYGAVSAGAADAAA